MITLAARAMSLVAAVAVTAGAGAVLATNGKLFDRPGPYIFHVSPYIMASTHPECLCFRPPPPLPKFIHPRAPRVKAPEILCEMPGDPTAVTDCGVEREVE